MCHAVLQMFVQNIGFHGLDGRPHGAQLGDDFRTVASVFYHFFDTLYLTGNAVYVDTELLGPDGTEQTADAVTCPYLVLKLEYLEQPVVFE